VSRSKSPRSSCPITCALDLLGDRWTLVVLRDVLLAGRRSFSELARPEGISTNVLSERLERLEAGGVLVVERDRTDGRRKLYTPTERGLELIPILIDLLIWGTAHTPGTAHAALAARARVDREQVIAEAVAAARSRSGR